MISVKFKWSYKGVPIEIEVSGETVHTFGTEGLGVILEKSMKFVDEMLEGEMKRAQQS